MNEILLVNLPGVRVVYIRFPRERGAIATLGRWQTNNRPVYIVWAAIVVIAFPHLFGFS